MHILLQDDVPCRQVGWLGVQNGYMTGGGCQPGGRRLAAGRRSRCCEVGGARHAHAEGPSSRVEERHSYTRTAGCHSISTTLMSSIHAHNPHRACKHMLSGGCWAAHNSRAQTRCRTRATMDPRAPTGLLCVPCVRPFCGLFWRCHHVQWGKSHLLLKQCSCQTTPCMQPQKSWHAGHRRVCVRSTRACTPAQCGGGTSQTPLPNKNKR